MSGEKSETEVASDLIKWITEDVHAAEERVRAEKASEREALRVELADLIDPHYDIGYDDNTGRILCLDGDWESARARHSEHVAELALEDGWRRLTPVASAEELDALPVMSIVIDNRGFPWCKHVDGWMCAGWNSQHQSYPLMLHFGPLRHLRMG